MEGSRLKKNVGSDKRWVPREERDHLCRGTATCQGASGPLPHGEVEEALWADFPRRTVPMGPSSSSVAVRTGGPIHCISQTQAL